MNLRQAMGFASWTKEKGYWKEYKDEARRQVKGNSVKGGKEFNGNRDRKL